VVADSAVTIIGGGVVGLAVAAEVSSLHTPTILIERHHSCGQETSGRNSEVIHAGIYYPAGSLKAQLCVEGRKRLYEICAAHDLPHKRIGKIITATSAAELMELDRLHGHGIGNGVELQRLTASEVHALEPNIATAGGILSPSTGIISAHALMDFFSRTARANGATIQTGCEVKGIERIAGGYRLTINDHGEDATFTTELVVNSAGLDADTVAAMAGIDIDKAGYRIHWAKGSYFAVHGQKRRVVSRLIYPLPPRESLGVHAVVDLGGGLRFGPDVEYLAERVQDYSVSALKREEFGRAVRKIIPSIEDGELMPDQSGIRAKLQQKGDSPKDFIIRNERDRGLDGFINLLGIDSPGLTASPAIARYVGSIVRELL
jgi:L-2-hydroxyglutarate oxidase LhgO